MTKTSVIFPDSLITNIVFHEIVETVAPAMYDTDNFFLRTELTKVQEANCTMTCLTIISFDPYRFF